MGPKNHPGPTTSTSTKSVDSYEGSIRSLVLPLLFNSTAPWNTSKLREYPDVGQLKQTLETLQYTPMIDPHRVGVLYVAPGQTREEEILSNTHGSLTYAHFLSRLTQVVDLASVGERVLARGLEPKLHGRYTRAWMDDIAAINFHVATMMPNIGDNMTKKAPIGNDAVKIIWNDSGRPYDFETFRSEFNLINIVIEPQSPALTSAYRTSLDGFLKVTMQTAPGVPRVTPIGDFKMVRLEYLPVMMRHFSIFACLFCESWTTTGRDGLERTPLQTNWKARLACIQRSEKYLKPEEP
jgi:Rap/ran-GAP